MSDLLFAWELGGSLWHIMRMRPLVEYAQSAGLTCSCFAILRNNAADLLPCPVEQAPHVAIPQHTNRPHIGHLADSLAALGWADPEQLLQGVMQWRDILKQQRPKALVMDAAPTALLAAQGLGIKRVWLGDPWSTPPDRSPLPDLAEQLLGVREGPDTEPGVTQAINHVLQHLEQPPIERFSQLFERVELLPLLTLAEIDPHGPRPGVEYRGSFGQQADPMPNWPASPHGESAPGVFAYLKPFDLRAATLKLLAASGLPTIAYTPGILDHEQQAVAGINSIRLIDKPVDWRQGKAQLGLVVCHGGQGMMSHAIQLGVPIVGIPLSLEQTANIHQASRFGSTVLAKHNDAESIRSAIHRCIADQSVIDAAAELGQRYQHLDPDKQARRLAVEIIALCRQG